VGGPPDVRFANSTWTNEETSDVRYFLRNTLWIIPSVVQIYCTCKCTSHVQYGGVQVRGRTHRELYY
jgi:hypothetical protein